MVLLPQQNSRIAVPKHDTFTLVVVASAAAVVRTTTTASRTASRIRTTVVAVGMLLLVPQAFVHCQYQASSARVNGGEPLRNRTRSGSSR